MDSRIAVRTRAVTGLVSLLVSALLGACGGEAEEPAVEGERTPSAVEGPTPASERAEPEARPPWTPFPGETTLPAFSAGRVLPPAEESVAVSIDARGYLRCGGDRPLALDGLKARLIRATSRFEREPDGTSPLPVVLYLDEDTAWRAVQWVLMTCAGPEVQIYRLAFVGRHESSGRRAAIEVDLPRSGRPWTPGSPTPTRRLEFSSREGHTEPGDGRYASFRRAVHAALVDWRESLAASGGEPVGRIELISEPNDLVRTGYVLQALDAARRAGFGDVTFEGAPLPRPNGEGGAATEPGAFARVARAAGGAHVRVRVGGDVEIDSETADGPVLLPGAFDARPHRRLARAGALDTPGESEEVTDVEVLVDEPVIEDEAVELPFEEILGAPPRPRAGKQRVDAVMDALLWLQAHQSPNGAWEAEGFRRWCDLEPNEGDLPDGAGKPEHDVGTTGLALLAFLGAGYTNRGQHPFKRTVSRGLRYLKSVQDPEGCFGARAAPTYAYGHAAAALAMVEAYGMTGSPLFKGSAKRAVDFVAKARNPGLAWRYGVRPGDNDTSVTAWMTRVLKAATLVNADAVRRGKPARFVVDAKAFDGVRAWLDEMTDPETGRVGYEARGAGPARPPALLDAFPSERSESMTAVGVLLRILLGEDPGQSEFVRKGADLCRALPPRWDPDDGSIDMAYWYYGALAMYQVGGEHWDVWKDAIDEAVRKTQRIDTDHCLYKGSWDPIGPWGPEGGRVYATALMAMCLELFYRYEHAFSARQGRPAHR